MTLTWWLSPIFVTCHVIVWVVGSCTSFSVSSPHCLLAGCRYETWRRHRLSRPKVGARFRKFALSTLVPVALAFYCAKHGVDVQAVRT